jgi:AraC family transcriptional regulator
MERPRLTIPTDVADVGGREVPLVEPRVEAGSGLAVRTSACDVVRGAGIDVWCASIGPDRWRECSHSRLQVTLFLEGADCGVVWRTPRGEIVERRIEGNHVWILPPGHTHAVSFNRSAGVVVLCPEMSWVGEVAVGMKFDASVRPVSDYVRHDHLIGDLVQEFRISCERAVARNRRHEVALGALLGARLLLAHGRARPGPLGLTREALDRVQRFVSAHLEEKLSLAVLAREGRYSPGHFSRLFKASTGLTPERFVLRVRLLRARELLGTGDFTVSEIAHRVGFCDHSHLTTQFKRMFGVPPKFYLRRR